MLSHLELYALVRRAPHWNLTASEYHELEESHTQNWHKANIWAPVLGDRGVSVLREAHDLLRALRLLVQHEARRGAQYKHVAFSRLEFQWLAPHPPIRLLLGRDGRMPDVWIPHMDFPSSGLNDRHAIMNRSTAATYFGRLNLQLSSELLLRIPQRTRLFGSPEVFLKAVLGVNRLPVRHFPATFVLACCRVGDVCFTHNCWNYTGVQLRGQGRGHVVSGKYMEELIFAVPHAAALNCRGATYARGWVQRPQIPSPADRNGSAHQSGYVLDVVVNVPAPLLHMWHPATPGASLVAAPGIGITSPIDTPWVHLTPDPRSQPIEALLPSSKAWRKLHVAPPLPQAPTASAKWFARPSVRVNHSEPLHCPASAAAPRQWWPPGATNGYCSKSSEEGDCLTGERGSFPSWRRAMEAEQEMRLDALSSCASLCAACARCRYVSVALSPGDEAGCSWSHSCDLLAVEPPRSRDIQQLQPNAVSFSLKDYAAYARLCRQHFAPSSCPDEIIGDLETLSPALAASPVEAVTLGRQGVGFCATTNGGLGDCTRGHLGVIEFGTLPAPTVEGCAKRCGRCLRCRYISFSLENQDCSWYAACDMDHLQLMEEVPQAHGHSYVSVELHIHRNHS